MPLDLIGWKVNVIFSLNQISKAVKSASSVKTASTGFALDGDGGGEVGGALKGAAGKKIALLLWH